MNGTRIYADYADDPDSYPGIIHPIRVNPRPVL